MTIDWTTNDLRNACRAGYNMHVSESSPGKLVYTILPAELPKAQAAAERGCETAKKALLILTLQRMKV